MRSAAPLALALLAVLAATPAAAGACVPSCEVGSTELAYLPPATLVQSGSVVTWSDTDGVGHSATDRVAFCFHVFYPPHGSGSARFDVVDGVLFATDGSGTAECTSATRTPDGAFALLYECLYHPNMEARLLVK